MVLTIEIYSGCQWCFL